MEFEELKRVRTLFFEHQRNLTSGALSTLSQLKIRLGCELVQGSLETQDVLFWP